MNKLIVVLMTIVLVFSTGCSNSKTVKANSEKLIIVIRETPCFGKCPTYEMKIYQNGLVEFIGQSHVEKIGTYTKSIPTKEVESLIDLFKEKDFFAFDDKYSAEMTDFPTTYTTFNYDGKSKTIEHYHGAPEDLKVLERTLRKIWKNEEGWEKIADKEEAQ